MRNAIPTPPEPHSAFAERHSDASGTPFRTCGTPLQHLRNPIPHLRNATPTPSEARSAFAERLPYSIKKRVPPCGSALFVIKLRDELANFYLLYLITERNNIQVVKHIVLLYPDCSRDKLQYATLDQP